MNRFSFRRGLGLAMTLTIALSTLPAAALAAETDGLCDHHTAHTADCGFEESGSCTHICTGDNGCITLSCSHIHVATCFDTAGNSLCRHDCSKEESCGQEVTKCLHTEHGSCGYAQGSPCSFAEDGCADCEAENALTSIIGTDVLIDGHSFPYTGQEIRPEITVTVDGTLLTEDVHYTLTYKDNVAPGEASVTVTGIEEAGYKGIVTIAFTITPAQQPEDSEDNDETEGTKPVSYQITKGSGSTWYQGSGKTLSFTANGKRTDFTGILVNGKALDDSYYTAEEDTVITLNKSFLNKLTVGKYTVTIRFADGEAEGTFTVSDKLDTSNPSTGDESNVGLWTMLAAGSLAALGGAAIVLRKREIQ